jgi:RNA polymerase sigma-70 factor (ECF subfamily)
MSGVNIVRLSAFLYSWQSLQVALDKRFLAMQPSKPLTSTNVAGMDEDVRQMLQKRLYAQAFERLLSLYENKVFRMAVAILRNPARAEEITQDVFLKLWQALPAYDGRAGPRTWLYAIARNACLAASRSDSYRRTMPLEDIHEPVRSGAGSRDIELAQCIGRLPEMQRQVITLFYLEERRIDDVARMLALPEGTVKSHLHRARLALAAMMKE